ncbi:MAG: hypothetical protein ACJASQ_003585 [Crocinitomicaceae bacterium]|jgi:hypothetical protein
MKKIVVFAIGLIILQSCGEANELEEKAKAAFHIDKPQGWVANPNQKLKDNLDRLDMDDAKAKKMLASHKGMIMLCAYTKYDPKTERGLMPTIQVNMAKNPSRDFNDFKNDMLKSTEQMELMFEGFNFLDGPKEITVDGHKAFFFQSEFDLSYDENGPVKVRSWTYAIPVEDYFYQINFSDMGDDDCSVLFKKIIASIKV